MIPRQSTASVRESKAAPATARRLSTLSFPARALVSDIPSQKETASRTHQPRKLTDEERRALFDNDRDRRMPNVWCAPRCDACAITAASVQSQSTCSLPSLVQTEIDNHRR
jgi:hypothetical protein